MASNQSPADELAPPPGFHNLATLMAQLTVHQPQGASPSFPSFWHPSLAAMTIPQPGSSTTRVQGLRCINPNCREDRPGVQWAFPYDPHKTICPACAQYQRKHGVHRSKDLCDNYYFRQLALGKKPYVRKPGTPKADIPYSDEENVQVYDAFKSLRVDACKSEKRIVALALSQKMGKKRRSAKCIIKHMESDTYKTWKVQHE